MWMMSCTGNVRGGFWGIWKKSVELSSYPGRRRLTFACWPKPGQWPCGGRHTWFGADGNVSIERRYLSLLMSKNLFNSKVMKSFVHEQRRRKCFFVFRDSYVLCIYVMNILCTFHISVSGVCYIYTYILSIYELLNFADYIFKWASAYFLHTVKWF